MLDRGARSRRGVRGHLPGPRRRSSTRASWPRRCGSSRAIHDLAGRAGSYAMLSFSLDTDRPGARRAHPEGAASWARRSRPSSSSSTSSGTRCRTSGRTSCLPTRSSGSPRTTCATSAATGPHQLSEPEERVLTETNVTGGSAFQRLFTEQTSALEVPLPDRDEPASLEEGLSRLQDPDRERRREAAEAVTARSAPACARARSSSTRCSRTRPRRTGCAGTRIGWRRATSRTRRATSRSRR